MFKTILLLTVTAALSQNFVLVKFLGICPFLGVSSKLKSSLSMGVAVIFVMLLATLATYPLYVYVLKPLDIEYLEIILFIFIIAALVQMLEKALAKFLPAVYRSMGIYLPLITTNCAILGVAELVLVGDLSGISPALGTAPMNLGYALLYALFAGVGFLIAMLLMGGVRERLQHLPIPKSMKGFPITMVTAGLMALSFYVFTLV